MFFEDAMSESVEVSKAGLPISTTMTDKLWKSLLNFQSNLSIQQVWDF